MAQTHILRIVGNERSVGNLGIKLFKYPDKKELAKDSSAKSKLYYLGLSLYQRMVQSRDIETLEQLKKILPEDERAGTEAQIDELEKEREDTYNQALSNKMPLVVLDKTEYRPQKYTELMEMLAQMSVLNFAIKSAITAFSTIIIDKIELEENNYDQKKELESFRTSLEQLILPKRPTGEIIIPTFKIITPEPTNEALTPFDKELIKYYESI